MRKVKYLNSLSAVRLIDLPIRFLALIALHIIEKRPADVAFIEMSTLVISLM